MKQEFTAQNYSDNNGNPAGGFVDGVGLAIKWQNGPLGRDEDRIDANGAFVETLIAATIQRIQYYQTANGGKFACRENALAITKLEEAGMWLDKRTNDREARKVEGTHNA